MHAETWASRKRVPPCAEGKGSLTTVHWHCCLWPDLWQSFPLTPFLSFVTSKYACGSGKDLTHSLPWGLASEKNFFLLDLTHILTYSGGGGGWLPAGCPWDLDGYVEARFHLRS